MLYNYSYFEEETTPKDEHVEEEIEILLEQINNEKRKVMIDLYNEKSRIAPKEREKEGKTINDLTCEIPETKHNGFIKFSRNKKINTEIRNGDLVLLTVNNTDIIDRRCKIHRITPNSVSIVTEDKIPKFSKRNTAKIDLMLNETTFRRWEKNLENLNENGKKALKFKRKEIATRTDNENKKITFFNKKLDKYQKRAVRRAVHSNDFFLIHGPFGTGKTTTIIELILQEVKQNHTVLVTGESNTAIDNILKKLKRKHEKIKFTRVGTPNKIPPYLRKYTLDYKVKQYLDNNKINDIEKLEIEESILKHSDVVLTTNSSAGSISLSNIRFNIAIIDEASQATIPSVLIPINKAKKFVLIGDHKQLPPVIFNNSTEYLKTSLFEELIDHYEHQSEELLIQYRMNEILMEFPNRKFYENKLICSEKSKEYFLESRSLGKYDSTSPLIFIDTSKHENNKEHSLDYSHSYTNNLESKIVLDIINICLDNGINPKDIGVISPYKNQVRLINKKTDVDVKSVDGFQGGEKDIIIISLVRSNDNGDIGFLKDLRRLNVSLTRAKEKLIVIGNGETLKSNNDYKEFLEFCEEFAHIHMYR